MGMSYTRVDDDGSGYPCYHMRCRTKFFLRNRSAILTQYTVDGEDGSFTSMLSSRGNGHLVERERTRIGSDVIADVVLRYHRFVPYDGGVRSPVSTLTTRRA